MVKSQKLVCQLNYGTKSFEANVTLCQKDDCSVIAIIDLRSSSSIVFESECFLESVSSSSCLLLKKTSGVITDKQNISAKLGKAELESKNIPSSEDEVLIKMYLTNLPYFKNEENNFSLNICGFQTVILSAYSEGAISHIAEVYRVPYSELNNYRELIDSICWLGSFASGCMSAIARVEVFHNDKLIALEFLSVDTTLQDSSNKRVICYEDFIQFIENTYNEYKKLNKTYLIENLISLGILAKHTPYTVVKTLLMSNFLEILRYNYAKNVGCSNNVFIQKGDNFEWKNGSKAGKRASLEDILQCFFSNYIITKWESKFKDIRNEIVHQGQVMGSTENDKIQNYQDLHHFCDCVILALLNWDKNLGYYIPQNNRIHKTPTSKKINRIRFNR